MPPQGFHQWALAHTTGTRKHYESRHLAIPFNRRLGHQATSRWRGLEQRRPLTVTGYRTAYIPKPSPHSGSTGVLAAGKGRKGDIVRKRMQHSTHRLKGSFDDAARRLGRAPNNS